VHAQAASRPGCNCERRYSGVTRPIKLSPALIPVQQDSEFNKGGEACVAYASLMRLLCRNKAYVTHRSCVFNLCVPKHTYSIKHGPLGLRGFKPRFFSLPKIVLFVQVTFSSFALNKDVYYSRVTSVQLNFFDFLVVLQSKHVTSFDKWSCDLTPL
jgi:hypothetical protein